MSSIFIQQLIHETEDGMNLSASMPRAESSDTWESIHKLFAVPARDIITPVELDSLVRYCQISFAHGSHIQDLAVSHSIHQDLIAFMAQNMELAFKALSNLITRNNICIDLVQSSVLESTMIKNLDDSWEMPTSALLFLRNSLFYTKAPEQTQRCERIVQSHMLCALLRASRETKLEAEDHSVRLALALAIMDTIFVEGFAQDCLDRCRHEQLGSCRTDVLKFLDQFCFLNKVEEASTVPLVLASELTLQIQMLIDVPEAVGEPIEMSTTKSIWIDLSILFSALAALLMQPSAAHLLRLVEMQKTIDSAVQTLGFAHMRFPRSKGGRNSDNSSSFTVPNLKRDCITIISNMSHGNRTIQDRVRELGGLPLILGQCNVDDLNPYLREHAMYCIRNLLDGNKENQDIVDSIKPVGVEQSSELMDLGFNAELRDGKVGVSRIPKIESINEM